MEAVTISPRTGSLWKRPTTPRLALEALLESVGYWAMPNINPKTFGGKLKPVSAARRDGWTVSSTCGVYYAL